MIRPTGVAVIALVAALVGGASALVIGKAVGWTDGAEATKTVLVPAVDGASPASRRLVPGSTAKPITGNDFDPAEIYRRRAAGVVTIIALFGSHAEDGTGSASQGSGFVVSKDGFVLTNSHVITTAGDGAPTDPIESASTVYVEFRDGDRIPAKVVGWDLYDDVGLLKVDPDGHALSPVPLGDSSTVVVGQPVAAIGSPFGNQSSLAVGVVSATERSIDSLTSSYNLVDAIQTDAPINRGNSGGPMLDARGLVVGVNAQIRSESGTAEGVGFAVPINAAKRSMAQLIASGEVRYGWVGISTQTLTPTLARHLDYGAERGAVVQSVVSGSPADKAGFSAGGAEEEFEGIRLRRGADLIVAINGYQVETAEDVVRVIALRLLPGQKARFTILRGTERRTLDVVLGERPAIPPGADR